MSAEQEARQSFDLEVVSATPNDPPEIRSTPRTTIGLGATYRYAVDVFDPNGDPLQYLLDKAPAGMTIDGLGQVVWTPQTDQIAPQPVRIRVQDSRGGQDVQEFVIQVQSQRSNQLPTIISNSALHSDSRRGVPIPGSGDGSRQRSIVL